ncbi:hypothetical protein ACFIOZ_05075 [Vreelandella sp. F11]|uniref:hypothetical protein n=1 Tax=Vreelandella sp. F11 TaxID=3394751 RepID=UPI0036DECB0A
MNSRMQVQVNALQESKISTFSLRDNIFYLLNYSPSNSRTDLKQRLRHNVQQSYLNAEEANTIESILVDSGMRLKAEVAWLPGVAFTQALQLVEGQLDKGALSASLARLNFSVQDLTTEIMLMPDALNDILDEWQKLNKAALLDSINQQRRSGQFSEVSLAELENALAWHAQCIAHAVVNAFEQHADSMLGSALLVISEDNKIDIVGNEIATLLFAVYHSKVAEELAELEEDIESMSNEIYQTVGLERGLSYEDIMSNGLMESEKKLFEYVAITEDKARKWASIAQPLVVFHNRAGSRFVPHEHLMWLISECSANFSSSIRLVTRDLNERLVNLALEVASGAPDALDSAHLIQELHVYMTEPLASDKYEPSAMQRGGGQQDLLNGIRQHYARLEKAGSPMALSNNFFSEFIEYLKQSPSEQDQLQAWHTLFIMVNSLLLDHAEYDHAASQLLLVEQAFPLTSEPGRRLKQWWLAFIEDEVISLPPEQGGQPMPKTCAVTQGETVLDNAETTQHSTTTTLLSRFSVKNILKWWEWVMPSKK